ncbi:DUF2239 family protein [Phenylobacterium sp. Root700]|uniref:DUF2239 family protein n=2 Tax=unclassified Phenylobacterium TaxID=2640670 RepID=UPI001F415D9A|nr:DUF2239 family protein [Phenylobacterium sp. Root700]
MKSHPQDGFMADTYTAFADQRQIAAGSLIAIAAAVKTAFDAGAPRLLVFNDATGRLLELDLRGSIDDVLTRLGESEGGSPSPAKPAGRGRPKLGVTAREVTLLPSHWEWLSTQPGGASAALRRLVDQAKRAGRDHVRETQEAAYRVMVALAGDLPDFEDATRAFYAGDYDRFEGLSKSWPTDIGDYVRHLVLRSMAAARV